MVMRFSKLLPFLFLLSVPVLALARDGAGGYASLQILRPHQDETIHDNNGRVPVALHLVPALQTAQGHRIQILLDGRPYGSDRAGTQFTLDNVDRGTHTLQAMVVDRAGDKLIASDSVTFHLWRASRLFPGRRAP